MRPETLRRIEALEQKRTEPPPEQEPEDRQALALWYAHQHDFARAAEVAGTTEAEAKAKWGANHQEALTQAIEQQQQDCEAYCQQQNARKPKPQEINKEEKPQSTTTLAPDRERGLWLASDKRRQGVTERQRERRRRHLERVGAWWAIGKGLEF